MDNNTLFDNPLAMAGLSVLSGKPLGDALTQAAALKQQNDWKNAQMQLWQAQAAQAMQQANALQTLQSGGMDYTQGNAPTDTTVQHPQYTGAMPPGMQAPNALPQAPTIVPFSQTPLAKKLANDISKAGMAGPAGAGYLESAKLQYQDAQKAYENQQAPALKAAEAKASAQGEAEGKLDNAATQKGKERLDAILNDVSSEYDLLKQKGGIGSETSPTAENLSAYVSSTWPGQQVAKIRRTPEQTIRENIAAKRPLISQAVMQATGMSAKQMDSNVELQNFLKSVGDPTASYESLKKTFADLSKNFGLGTVKGLEDMPNPKATKGGSSPSKPSSTGGIKFLGFE